MAGGVREDAPAEDALHGDGLANLSTGHADLGLGALAFATSIVVREGVVSRTLRIGTLSVADGFVGLDTAIEAEDEEQATQSEKKGEKLGTHEKVFQ